MSEDEPFFETFLRMAGTSGIKRPSFAYRPRTDPHGDPRPNTIETPPGIARFLRDIIGGEYDVRTILDPCAGRGALAEPWVGCEVISYEILEGRDFFGFEGRIDCDLVLANPPFNNGPGGGKGYPPAEFLAHILEVVAAGTPIALIAPMGLRLNQRSRSRRWRWLRDQAPPITGIVSLPLDVFRGVAFHTEILLFDLGRLPPHCFLPDEYLS